MAIFHCYISYMTVICVFTRGIQVHVFNGKPQTEEGSELDRRAELRGGSHGDPMGSPELFGESTEMVI